MGGAIKENAGCNPPTPSLVPTPSVHSTGGEIAESAGSGSGGNGEPEVMPFTLGDGEAEEASSFVPRSITGSRAGRPLRWSMEYLKENAEGGCGMIMGKGNFGETERFGVLNERLHSSLRVDEA